MKKSNIIILVVAALIFFTAFFVAVFPSYLNKQFSFDYATYEALAVDHPAKDFIFERLRESEGFLRDDVEENDVDGYLGLAFYVRQLGDDEGAISLYKEALKLNPDHTLALNNIATSYRDTGDFKSAEEAYRKIIDISPGDVVAYRNFADVYIHQYPNDEAGLLEVLEIGLESVFNTGDILSYIGVYYRDREDYRKAIEYFERFLKYNPGNNIVENEIGELRAKLSQ